MEQSLQDLVTDLGFIAADRLVVLLVKDGAVGANRQVEDTSSGSRHKIGW
jgi:hypothetical protein